MVRPTGLFVHYWSIIVQEIDRKLTGYLIGRRKGVSMVAHLIANQKSRVQIQLLPTKTLSVLRWVAILEGTVPCAGF